MAMPSSEWTRCEVTVDKVLDSYTARLTMRSTDPPRGKRWRRIKFPIAFLPAGFRVGQSLDLQFRWVPPTAPSPGETSEAETAEGATPQRDPDPQIPPAGFAEPGVPMERTSGLVGGSPSVAPRHEVVAGAPVPNPDESQLLTFGARQHSLNIDQVEPS